VAASKDELLDMLTECTDTIARLVVAMLPEQRDLEALKVMDKAFKMLEANGRGD
jgi:hypothetical protein